MTSTKFHSQPLFTRRQLTALLLPLIAEQALSVTIGLADTLMVSSVGEAAVSGVSLVDTFNTLMIQIRLLLAWLFFPPCGLFRFSSSLRVCLLCAAAPAQRLPGSRQALPLHPILTQVRAGVNRMEREFSLKFCEKLVYIYCFLEEGVV